jgi:hypothetical protein
MDDEVDPQLRENCSEDLCGRVFSLSCKLNAMDRSEPNGSKACWTGVRDTSIILILVSSTLQLAVHGASNVSEPYSTNCLPVLILLVDASPLVTSILGLGADVTAIRIDVVLVRV